MWRTIRMCYIRISPYAYVDLWKICCIAFELSCGHLEDIDIKRFCIDDLLKCIADHGSQLRCMRLVNCCLITDKGFGKAMRKLPQLEKVDISYCCLTDVS
ncbi:putative leucine-rich repeat domain, L domain-containing protein [Medicago truncatula]|nr:putative leucine-rich repeat domain, L domain-containing protein [Medicago truncatula]